MTAAQKLIDKGEAIGRQEGMQLGRQTREVEIAERMLKLHLDMYTIQQATGLLEEEVIQLKEKLGL